MLTEAAAGGAELLRQAKRRLALGDLFFLLTWVLGRRDLGRSDWLFERCREVQASPNGHLDLWFRGAGKSSIITFGLTIQDILNDPETTIGIFSHTRPIAKAFLRQIKREFETNDELKALFPDVLWAEPHKEAQTWSEDSGIVVKRQGNPKEQTVEAWGLVDGMPTSKHYNKLVFDDVVTRESVTSAEMIRKTTEAWELATNLIAEGGVYRYIGTRYAIMDSYATMIDRGVVKTRIHPATDDGTLTGTPVLWTPEQWADKKKLQSSTIAAQLLLNPLAAGQATFDVTWLRGFYLRPRTLNVYILGDPSMGPQARGRDTDSCALAVVGISATGARYLLDGYCHRMPLSERWTNLRNLYWKWNNTPGVMMCRVGYERYGLQSDLEYFEEQQRREGRSFPIDEVSWTREGGQSKDARISRLEPWFRRSQFFIPALVDPLCAPMDEAGDRHPYAKWLVDKNAVKYRGLIGPPSEIAKAREQGVEDLIQMPIRRLDEERRAYDVVARFCEEYVTHPVGAHDDFLDAMSRVEDMEPVTPRTFSEGELETPDWPDA